MEVFSRLWVLRGWGLRWRVLELCFFELGILMG